MFDWSTWQMGKCAKIFCTFAVIFFGGNPSSWAHGTFSGAISISQDMSCRIVNGRDTELVSCKVDKDPRFNIPRVTLQFGAFQLLYPPVCTVTGLTPSSGSVGDAGKQGSLPAVSRSTTTDVSFVLNGIPILPCACGNVANFICSISE